MVGRLAQNGQFGESWNWRLGAAGAFVVALAARRPWFCCHQRVAVLLRFGRRRTGLTDVAALGRGVQNFFVATPGLTPITGSPAPGGAVPAAHSYGY